MLRAIAAAREAARPAWGRPEPPPPLVGPARQADPDRGGAGGRLVRCRRGRRRGARGVGRDARRRGAPPAVRAARLGRPVLPRGRPGARRGPRGAAHAAAAGSGTPTRRTTGPACCSSRPRWAISTPAAFRAWDDGARVAGGAARLASAHLAEELRKGLRVGDLLTRASVLAAANDLAPAAAVVEPALVPFKRALLRLLGRPVGLSGSGPSHWALYPSHAEAAAAAETLRAARSTRGAAKPGRGGAVRRRHPDPRHDRPRHEEGAMTRQAVSTTGAPAAIGPYSQGIDADGLVFCSGQLGLDPATGEPRRRRRRGPGRAGAQEPRRGAGRGRARRSRTW